MNNNATPNQEQIKSFIRWAVATFGAAVAGFIAGKGWATSDQVIAVVSSDEFIQGISTVITILSLIWGLFVHRQSNAVKVVASIDPQMKVVVPDHIIVTDSKIAALVADGGVPNVIKAGP